MNSSQENKSWRSIVKNRISLWFVAKKKAFYFWLCRLCWQFIKASEDKLPETTTSLPDLCPTSYAEGTEAYEDRLTDLLLNHHKVTEIALTSPYSGGKSSLIDTYMRKHPYHRYTNISLADFKVGSERQDDPINIGQVQLIEKSIVQQILYRVKDSEMPNSRFRKIVMRKPSWQWLLAQPLGLLITLISAAIVIFPTSNITTSLNTLLGVLHLNLSAYVFQFALLFLFTFPFLLLKDLFKYLNKFSVSKLNLLKGEVTLDVKNNDSIFNLHIEEIVYYFSATRSNIVIFEDLDRFDKPEIFIKLKEINKLINDSNEVGQRVCFIYALKDDVFNGSNRTKFFDAIIPIIPITNSVNSYPRLKKLLEDSDLLFGLRDEFLRDVAVFIEDMRMLKNIVTEYSIYKQTLKSSIQQPELYRLFSFIIYKNIYCADFSKLQANQGVLADFFKNKHKLQQSFVGNTQIEIETLESEIKAIEGEKLRSIEEVNAVFTIALLNELDNNSVYLLNGMSLSNFIAHDVFHKAWVSDSLINYNTSHYNRAQSAKKLSDYSDIISPSYSLRKQYLEDRANNSTATLNQQIKTLKSKAKHCQKSSVKELTKLVSRDELYSHLLEGGNSEQPSKKVDYTLLIHLIEKGYVDEMYHVYISHFLEGHVTKGDMNFVLKVKSNQPFDCEAPLIEKNEIFKYLNSDDYNNEAVFNYDLINHLIGEGETEHLKMIVSMVKSDSSVLDAKAIFESLKFIDDKKAWLKEIVTEWQSIWPDIINTGTLNTVEKNEFLVTLLANLYGAFENTPLPMKEEYIPTVKKYIDEISHLSTLMPESDDEYTNVIDGLKFLKIQLMDFEAGESNGQFITDIIHCNLFLPSIGNYKHLASIISNKPIDDIEMSLSAFQSLEDVSMSNQIDCNINNFVSNVLFNDSFIIGEESSSLYLLNHNHLSKDLKEELIDKEDFVITNLLDIDDKHFWPQLLKRNKLKVSWKNIQSLLIENKLYAAAIDYLSAEYVYSILTSKEEVEHVHVLDKQLDSFVNILISSDFDIKVFKIYCPLFKDLILAVHLSDLETDQVSVLIDYKYVIFTEESYAAIEDYHPSLLINFIENNFYNVFHSKVYSGLTFTEQELLQLLTSDMIDSDLKVVASSKLEDQTASISKAFFEVYFEIFISAPTEIPKHLLRLLLSLKLAILSKKVILLTSQIKYISKELTFEFLGSFGEQYSRLFRTQSHCRLDNNKENRALAEALVEQGYFSMSKISDYVDTIRLNKRGK